MTPEDRDRFTALFEEHARRVLGYAFRRLSEQHEAADVVSEVFLVVWRRLDDVPTGEPDARLWILGTARRVLANHRRSARRRSRLAQVIDLHVPRVAPSPAPTIDPMISVAVGRLNEDERELIRLSSWEQLTPAEIAVVLGIAPGAARTRLHRARKRLVEELQAVGWHANDVEEGSNR